MPTILNADEAAALIPDGATVACVGVIGWLVPDAILAAVGRRFESTQSPRGITLYCPVAVGDAVGIPGMDHLGSRGLLKRIVSGSYINPVNPATGHRPRIMQLIHADAIEAYSWPIGATMHWLREVARRGPGYMTQIGLGCYIDPRLTGGKLTKTATADLVRLVSFEDQEYLFYPTWPLDVGIVRGTAVDEHGNLAMHREPLSSAVSAMAMAVKASGGTVIAQVAEQIAHAELPSARDWLPAELIDVVVVAPDQLMTTGLSYESAYLEDRLAPLTPVPRVEDTVSRLVAGYVASMVRAPEVTIFGFGMSSDVPAMMVEFGLLTADNIADFHFTTEHGPFGGVVMSGWQFSANLNPLALLDGPSQFDFINGGGCHTAVLSFAEFDSVGRVNVSRFGSANPGAGGYIDIAHNARRLILAGSLSTGGLEVAVGVGGQLNLVREGRQRKFTRAVTDVTYSVADGVVKRGQRTTIVTERAVFEVTADGLLLTDVAPGIDIRANVIDQMEFTPLVSRDLRVMSTGTLVDSSSTAANSR